MDFKYLILTVVVLAGEKSYAQNSPQQLLEHARAIANNQPDSAAILSSRAWHESVAWQQENWIAESALQHGIHMRALTRYDSALHCLALAQQMFENANNVQRLSDCYNEMALVHEMVGHFEKALAYNQKSLALREQTGDVKGLSNTYNNFGIIYSNLGNFVEARYYYKKSLTLSQQSGDYRAQANALNNVAISYYYQDSAYEALVYFQLAMAIRKKLPDKNQVIESYHNVADALMMVNETDSALHYYTKASFLADSLHNTYLRVYSLLGIADVYKKKQRPLISIIHAEEALTIARQLGILREQRIISEALYSLYKQTNQWQKALEAYEVHKQTSDSLFSLDKAKAIASLEASALLDKKELQLSAQQRISKQQRYALYSLGIALLSSLVAAVLYNRARRREKAGRKIVEEQKEKIQSQADALETANRNKDKLLAIIGHDLRGPIGSLKGLLELVSAGQLSASEFAQLSAKLRGSVDNLFHLVNHLLQWANTQLKGIKPNPRLQDLSALVKENIELLDVIAVKKNITLLNEMPSAAWAWADTNLVNVILRNLISNALKYTQASGTVRVTAQIDSYWVAISVADTGLGMDDETISKLFSASVTSVAGTSGEKGTGLGLSLCKDFVAQQGGTLSVTSHVGKGSIFTFTLPTRESP